MKTLIVVRHAKSSWEDPGQSDFDRILNHRGEHDAPLMAARLHNTVRSIDLIVSSPAARALRTATIFAESYELPATALTQQASLYHAAPQIFRNTVLQLPNHVNTVAIFSHNPGITAFVNELTEAVKTDNMPTCGVFVVTADTASWSAFFDVPRKFLLFDYPKLIK